MPIALSLEYFDGCQCWKLDQYRDQEQDEDQHDTANTKTKNKTKWQYHDQDLHCNSPDYTIEAWVKPVPSVSGDSW